VRALGVDYGRKRIGLALSDATGLLARPWKTLASDGQPATAAASLRAELESLRAGGEPVDVIVVGLPRRLSGEPHEGTAAVSAFAAILRELPGAPSVVFQDERLTSREAESRLASRERDWRRRKPLIDAEAASIVLQDYLDALPRPAPELTETD
jgi:putative Holliday junction resolvase